MKVLSSIKYMMFNLSLLIFCIEIYVLPDNLYELIRLYRQVPIIMTYLIEIGELI
jgi:hypothetical protein